MRNVFENPKYSHEMTMYQILKWFISTKRDESRCNKALSNFKGINYKPDKNKGFDVFVDASFAGDWNKLHSEEPSSVMSRPGFLSNAWIVQCVGLQNYKLK